LYLHETYTRSGFDVTIHPPLPFSEKHPDFLMVNGSESFYLEAVRVGKSVEEIGRDRRLAEVMAVLETIKGSRFTVSFSYLKIGPGAISAKRLGEVIAAWLDWLDPGAVMAGLPQDNVFANLPSMEWESDDWVLEFHALPVKPEAWGKGLSLIGMKGMGEAVMVDNVSGQLKVLKHKAHRYGDLDHPLVIAVMSNTDIATKDYEVSEAMYGRLNRSPEAAAEDARNNVFSDGHWLTPQGWRRGDAPQVIAVSRLVPDLVTRVSPRLWSTLEPGVKMPQQPSWLSRVDMGTQMPQVVPGTDLAELLGLPDDWLEGEPDFVS
jgi:hypothetical protein